MRHAGTQEIETPRLLLRRLMPSDAPMMYSNWANDPEVTRWLRWTPHKDVAETQELLSAWALLYPNEDYYQWAIVEKATGQVFGSISIYNSLLGSQPSAAAGFPARKSCPRERCQPGHPLPERPLQRPCVPSSPYGLRGPSDTGP